MLLTNDLTAQGQAELFRDGVHLSSYRESEELLDKARYYLAHDVIRERIASSGRKEAHEKHTYRLRMMRVLEEMEPHTSRTVASTRTVPLATHQAAESTANGSLERDLPVDWGLTSIVILTHNQLQFTRGCIESIHRNTPEPFELIVVDNGSTDGTPEYLRTIANATVIVNTENLGFPAGVNQGLRCAWQANSIAQ